MTYDSKASLHASHPILSLHLGPFLTLSLAHTGRDEDPEAEEPASSGLRELQLHRLGEECLQHPRQDGLLPPLQ